MKLLPNVSCHDNQIKERKICLQTRERPSIPRPLFESCHHCQAGGGFSYTNMPIPDPERSPLSGVKFSASLANKRSKKDQNEMWL